MKFDATSILATRQAVIVTGIRKLWQAVADLCTPWKGFQYSENKFPYSAIIFRSVIFLVAPPIAKKQTKKTNKLAPPTVTGK